MADVETDEVLALRARVAEFEARLRAERKATRERVRAHRAAKVARKRRQERDAGG